MVYADIIVDISHENLDKTYQFAVPENLQEKAVIGSLVRFPFGKGNRMLKGYIISLSDVPKIDTQYMKEITEVVDNALLMETQLIQMAYWIRDNYGATMNDALRIVLPVKQSVKSIERKTIRLSISLEEANKLREELVRKNHRA
ncbi:MAG TPA: primosomal protein N', partial [Lachnospiraceae bacterium]|nr:primosomal protein N' [Lachnospiraceae bacterium]